jgi:hypothetical protein
MASKKMTESELASLLDGQIQDAVSYEEAELADLRDKALKYRDGVMDDVPAETGKSSVVSMDVQDTIQWIKPGLLRIFANSDRVVEFEPMRPDDEQSAKQATDYINYIFQRECNGYKVLLDAFDDGLGLGNGIVMHWWDPTPCYETSTHSGLSDDQLTELVEDENVEVLEHTEHPAPMVAMEPQLSPDAMGGQLPAPQGKVHDLKIKRTIPTGKLRVEALPPEELLIPRDAKCIDENISGIGRQRIVTRSTLIKEGFKKAEVTELPRYMGDSDDQAQLARDSKWSWDGTTNPDQSMEKVRVYEWYPLVDFDGDGVAERRRVVISDRGAHKGDEGNSTRSILAHDEWGDDLPFTELVPNPVPHRRRGRSIYDDTQDIQRIKTVLQRQTLDNLYHVNNPMIAVREGSVDNLEPLLKRELGATVRVNGNPNDATAILAVPFIAESSFTALEYFDAVRQGRTGVGRQTMGLDPDALQDQTAEAVRDGRAASETQVEFFARNIAEGMRRLFRAILKLIIKHQDRPKQIRLRDQWVDMDPRPWNAEMDCSINVGLGAGSKDRDMVMLQAIAGKQENILLQLGPDNPLCSLMEYRNTLAEMVGVGGLRSAEKYFKEVTPEAIQQMAQAMGEKQDPAIQVAQMKAQTDMQALQMKGQIDTQKQQTDAQLKERELQMKAQIEQLQAEADIAVEQRKTEAAIMLEREKFELERELKIMEAGIKREQMSADMQMKQADHELKQRDMHAQHGFKAQELEHKAKTDGLKKHKSDHGDEYLSAEEERGRRQEKMMEAMMKSLKRPKGTRIVRDAKGKAERAEYEYDD